MFQKQQNVFFPVYVNLNPSFHVQNRFYLNFFLPRASGSAYIMRIREISLNADPCEFVSETRN